MNLTSAHRFVVSIALILFPAVSSLAQSPDRKKDLTGADRETWRKVLKWPEDCEDAFQKTYGYRGASDYAGVEFFSLGNQKYLVRVACWSGAYQPGFMFIYYDERSPSSVKPLQLRGYESTDDHGALLSYSLIDGLDTFNEKTKLLEIFSKYRGPGDCGRLIRYKVVKDRLIVVEARERKCDETSRRPTNSRFWPRIKL